MSPFCAVCGTTKRLQVHHLVPFRLTADNSGANLTPLCVKHHKRIEAITNEVESLGVEAFRGLIVRLRAQQGATAMYLTRLKDGVA